MAGPVPNARSRRIEESVTLAIMAKAQRYKAAGKNVVSLAAGEPDFPTPGPIADAGIAAIQQGRTRYTATSGVPELRQAGALWFRTAYGIDFAPEEVMACAGAKAALHMALHTVVEKHDNILILAPYWVSYPALVTLADGNPIVLPAVPDEGFVHSAAAIDAAFRQHQARGILINFPNNPSGAVPSRAQVQAFVDVAKAHDAWILSDEIYGSLLYDGATHVSPATLPGGRERTIVVNGFTKSHTLTGWRISFLAAPRPVIEAAGRLQSQALGNPCTISQEAAIAACKQPLTSELERRMQAFDGRRRYLVDEINKIAGLQLQAPKGAFYALVDVRALCKRLSCDDVAIAERLLEEQLLAVVPGTAFAIPGFIRLSYAASMDDLRAAVTRLRAFAAGLS
ncbi:MAG: pyridoxal phosphate-dependent aminotransferase [Planctomycetes bacterium]|nr:pyridoxal phosphate-dependent aminotransferase [Planctomycetota bacterium]